MWVLQISYLSMSVTHVGLQRFQYKFGTPMQVRAAVRLVLVAALLTPSRTHPTGHKCSHDKSARHTTGGVRGLGYSFNRAVPYAEGNHHARRTQTTTWEPIRIQLDYSAGATNGLSSELQTFLRDSLVPGAVQWIQNALSVVPVTGALKHARFCGSSFTSGTCAAEGAIPTCGLTSAGSDYQVPAAFLDELTACQTCYADTSIPCEGCSTSQAGAGATGTDFVLFVSAVGTSSCSGGTLAYASTCQRDQQDRPIFGEANFCPSSLDTSADEWDKQLSTAVHEILHAIGFASGSWPLFRNADGTPMTPRESDGLPALATVTCTDGVSRAGVIQVANNTIEVATERGTTVTRLVTPKVRSVARDIFGCDTLTGAELENQPTGAGSCYASHWEQRNFMNEIMAPISSHHAVYSALTLAALEDSGWYRANYSATQPLLWGRNKGCSFISSKCVDGGTAIDGFCTDAGTTGCTPGHRAKAHCDLTTFSSSLPAQYQYFTSATQGGGMIEADYCPHMNAYSNGNCHVAANAPSTNYRAEIYAEGSMCFETSLSQPIGGYTISSASGQGCYSTRCADGVYEIMLSNSTGGSIWLACPSGGGNVSPPDGSGISGSITCPTTSALLCNPSACPGLPCDGTSACVHGVCMCGTAFGGVTCTPEPAIGAPRTPPTPPMPPPSPTPPPPPISPSPSSPPVPAVAFTLVVAGTVDSFDEAAFKSALAMKLANGITSDHITLTVMAASVSVDVSIIAASASAASAAATVLESSTISELSSDLGVTVESITAVTTGTLQGGIVTPSRACADTCAYSSDDECDDGGSGSEYTQCTLGEDCTDCGPRIVPMPPPLASPSPPSPSSPPGSGSSAGIIIGVIAAVVVIGCLCFCFVVYMRGRTSDKIKGGTPAAAYTV